MTSTRGTSVPAYRILYYHCTSDIREMTSPEEDEQKQHVVWDVIMHHGEFSSAFWSVFQDIRIMGKLAQVARRFRLSVPTNEFGWDIVSRKCFFHINKAIAKEVFLLQDSELKHVQYNVFCDKVWPVCRDKYKVKTFLPNLIEETLTDLSDLLGFQNAGCGRTL